MDQTPDKKSFFSLRPGWLNARDPALFKSSELEIVVNRKTIEVWIFHLPPLPIEIETVEYDHKANTITFVSQAGKRYDLGIKPRHLTRPVIEKAERITVAQVYEGMPQSWFNLPITHKPKQKGDKSL
ncbi:MAG: hypothetical protein EOM26_08340 [Alphaproteobacteria bacterium]|nr:hypothetical protein [Alphaproteobacteria bacterium]